MGEIVNLNKFRKARAKENQATIAAANRSRFGRTKPERREQQDQVSRIENLLNCSKLEADPPPEAS